MADVLDAAAVRRWSRAAVEQLAASRDEIDALNVFPVADRDTGTNMLATLRAAELALQAVPERAGGDGSGRALSALADGAARGAVGNSGFILSQVLRGLADAAVAAGRWDAPALAAGLAAGVRLGRLAVVTPLEGTILTVAAAAADDALAACEGGFAATAAASLAGAGDALARTPSLLPVLADAGVVDAGGQGLVVLLDVLAAIAGGTALDAGSATVSDVVTPVTPVAAAESFAFEVQYLLDADAAAVHTLRDALAGLGDSVAVVPVGAATWKVHAHVDDVGTAIELGLRAGRPHAIEVVHFADQLRGHPLVRGDAVPATSGLTSRATKERARREDVASEAPHPHGQGDIVREDVASEAPQPREPESMVVAVAPGAGLVHLFEAEGVHAVEVAGRTPSADDVLAAIDASGARRVVLLPNASRVTGVAEAAAARAREQGRQVAVVPTRSPVQGLAAVAVHDPDRRFDDDVVAMAEAAAATRFAELTVAREHALTAAGACQPGDVLGLIDGEVVEVGRGLLAVAFAVIDRLLGVGAELMTLLVGQDAPHRLGEFVEAHVRGRAPLTDIAVYESGQPDAPLVIGVE